MIFSLLFLFSTLAIFNQFVNGVEARPGAVLDDVILNSLPPFDLHWLIFILIYGSLFAAIFVSTRKPSFVKILLQGYSWMLWFRMAAMKVTPLAPPRQMITLRDPLVELFGANRVLTKDLFFSGHTATLFLFFLFAHEYRSQNRAAANAWPIFLLNAVLVGFCVLVQHVHYCIDVMAAPLFSWAAFRFTLWLARIFAKPLISKS